MQEWINWAVASGIIVLSVLLGFLIRRIIFRRLIKFSMKTSWKGDEIIIDAVRSPFLLWVIICGVFLALNMVDVPVRFKIIIDKVLLSILIFSVTLVIANIATRLITVYGSRVGAAVPVTGLTQNITKTVIILIGFMILLNSLGIAITPLITTLGIGGVAVALGLQETLSNLFAGFHITLAKQVRVGDFVKLETGEEGYVEDIGWRSTKVRMLPNNIVLVPNSKLAQSILTNYYLPAKDLAVLVQVGVHYDSDLRHVEKVTCEVAKEVMKTVPGGIPEFDPFIRYHTFADFSINFTVILRAKEFVDNYLIKHEFIKRLHERYRKEGIIIPYPIRAINYGQEKASKDL